MIGFWQLVLLAALVVGVWASYKRLSEKKPVRRRETDRRVTDLSYCRVCGVHVDQGCDREDCGFVSER